MVHVEYRQENMQVISSRKHKMHFLAVVQSIAILLYYYFAHDSQSRDGEFQEE